MKNSPEYYSRKNTWSSIWIRKLNPLRIKFGGWARQLLWQYERMWHKISNNLKNSIIKIIRFHCSKVQSEDMQYAPLMSVAWFQIHKNCSKTPLPYVPRRIKKHMLTQHNYQWYHQCYLCHCVHEQTWKIRTKL